MSPVLEQAFHAPRQLEGQGRTEGIGGLRLSAVPSNLSQLCPIFPKLPPEKEAAAWARRETAALTPMMRVEYSLDILKVVCVCWTRFRCLRVVDSLLMTALDMHLFWTNRKVVTPLRCYSSILALDVAGAAGAGKAAFQCGTLKVAPIL
jgi:hypothetical protein